MADEPQAESRFAGLLDDGAFYLLAVILAMRPLVTETFESALPSVVRSLGFIGATSPATTAIFDVGIWIAAVAATLAIWIRRERWRWTGIEVGWLFLLIAAVISTLSTSNQRIAINASANWLTALVLLMVLANLCRDRLRVGLLLAIVVASGMTAATKCAMYVLVEQKETHRSYFAQKEQQWASQGIPLDDPRVELFERRMDSGEASGFLPFSNVQGIGLGLATFAALALGRLVGRGRWRRTLVVLLALVSFLMILTTGSLGALLATSAGLVLLLILCRVHSSLWRRWRMTLVVAWLGIVVVAAAVIGHGIKHDSLPGTSLAFRWNYWKVTSHIIAEHIWTGVGALNFDRAYLQHKPIEFPEEIKDPHNFVMAIIAQWGILGGVGLALTLIGGSIVVARTWSLATTTEHSDDDRILHQDLWRWILAIIIGYFAVRLWLLRPFLSIGLEGQAYIFFDLALYGLIWCISFAATAWLASSSEPGSCIHVTPLCAVFAFLLHNTIGFSLFYPGTLISFAAIASLMFVPWGQVPVPATNSQWRRAVPSIAAIAGLSAFIGLVYQPVTRSKRWLLEARFRTAQAVRDPAAYAKATEAYSGAARADHYDPTPPFEAAALPLRTRALKLGHLDAALHELNEAIRRDPDAIDSYRRRARLLMLRARRSGAMLDLVAARAAAMKVVQLYPASPDDHVSLAQILEQFARVSHAAQWTSEAAEHYRMALELDSARPDQEEIRRWSPERRTHIMARIEYLQLQLSPIAFPSTQPCL